MPKNTEEKDRSRNQCYPNPTSQKGTTVIKNYWWGWRIPKELEECRTALLPKKEENLEEVGNWRQITIGNLFIRLYAKTRNKRLRKNNILDERLKGPVLVDGYFENTKILQQTIKQQRKKRKGYNLVFIGLAKAFDYHIRDRS